MIRLALVAIGLVGFGVFTSYTLQHLHSSHGAVVIGLLPLATTVAGALLARERHRKVGQVQRLQPYLTIGFAALFLSEPPDPLTVVTGS